MAHSTQSRPAPSSEAGKKEPELVSPFEVHRPCLKEYVPQVRRILGDQEVACPLKLGYMKRQQDINANMRAILVDWLVEVHRAHNLQSETLFLTVYLLDAFLTRWSTKRRHLQLLGVAALLIAAKFQHEQKRLRNSDLVRLCRQAYSKRDIMRTEVLILKTVNFQVFATTAVDFLNLFQLTHSCPEVQHCLSLYLLELSLVEYKMIQYSGSYLAAAAVLLSTALLRRSPFFTPFAAGCNFEARRTIKACAKDMCFLLESARVSPRQAVSRKFSRPALCSVARMSFGSCRPSTPVSSGRALRKRLTVKTRPKVRRSASTATKAGAWPSGSTPLSLRTVQAMMWLTVRAGNSGA